MIESLFPPGVVALEATGAMWDLPLPPEEEAWVRNAAPGRRREFAAGRHCSRAALDRLGVPVRTLPSGPDRLPRWPAGVVGSITHADGRCLAAVAPQAVAVSLGLDLARLDAVTSTLEPFIGSGEEIEAARTDSGLARAGAAALVFSAKEAVYKCCYPLTGVFWDFGDVEIRITGERRFAAGLRRVRDPLPPRLEGRFAIDGNCVLTAAILRAADLTPRGGAARAPWPARARSCPPGR